MPYDQEFKINKLKLFVVIVNRDQGDFFVKKFEEVGVGASFEIYGRGTATKEIYEILGVGVTKKDIIFRVCMQLVLLFVLANSISAIFMHDANQLITSFIITIVSCLLLWIIPIVKIMRTTIDQMLRWR